MVFISVVSYAPKINKFFEYISKANTNLITPAVCLERKKSLLMIYQENGVSNCRHEVNNVHIFCVLISNVPKKAYDKQNEQDDGFFRQTLRLFVILSNLSIAIIHTLVYSHTTAIDSDKKKKRFLIAIKKQFS